MQDLNTPNNNPEGNLDQVVSQLNKLLREIEAAKVQIEDATAAEQDAFDMKFDNLDVKIKPLVLKINQQLEGKRRLHLFTDKKLKESDSNRKFFQIVFSDDPNYADVLHSPYLLIEGYPKSGKVRIIQSNAEEEGNTIDVEKVNEDLLTSSMASLMASFLKATALSHK